MSEFLTQSDYARHRGCSPAAVSKAIESGRLKHSLREVNGGKVVIVSAAMADLEWDANTNAAKSRVSAAGEGSPPLPLASDDETPSLKDAMAAEKHWKAKLAELEFKRAAGELVDAKEAAAMMANDYAKVRTKLLGVPNKLKHRRPDLTREDLAVLDSIIRESLEELAQAPYTEGNDDANLAGA